MLKKQQLAIYTKSLFCFLCKMYIKKIQSIRQIRVCPIDDCFQVFPKIKPSQKKGRFKNSVLACQFGFSRDIDTLRLSHA